MPFVNGALLHFVNCQLNELKTLSYMDINLNLNMHSNRIISRMTKNRSQGTAIPKIHFNFNISDSIEQGNRNSR